MTDYQYPAQPPQYNQYPQQQQQPQYQPDPYSQPNQNQNNQYGQPQPYYQEPQAQQQPQYQYPQQPSYQMQNQGNYNQVHNDQSPYQQNIDMPPQSYEDGEYLLRSSSKLKEIGFNERKGFIVKVYTLISIQLFITFALVMAAYLKQGFRNFVVDPYTGALTAFSWVCFAVMFITEIAIFCCRNVARKVPQNYIAMFLFTFSFGVLVAAICGSVFTVYSANGGFIVLASALLTFAVTVSLTVYACTTKTDFTMMGGALWIIFMVLMVVFIISWFNTSVVLELIIAGLVIICYGFYLIYDTQLIMGGKNYELSIDDYVIAAMLIYIDIIILFLRILQILAILFGKK